MKLTASNIIKVLGLEESATLVSIGYEEGAPNIIIPKSTEVLTHESMNLYVTWKDRNRNISLDIGKDLLSTAFNAQFKIQAMSSHHDGYLGNEEHVFHYRLLPRIQWVHKRTTDITTKQIITTLGLNKNQYDEVSHKFLNDGHSFVLYNTSAITDLLALKVKIEHSKISTGYLVSLRKTNKQNVEILFTKIIQDNNPSKLFTPRYIGSIFGLTKNDYQNIDIAKCHTLCGRKQYTFELDVDWLASVYNTDDRDYFKTIYALLGEKPPILSSVKLVTGSYGIYKWVEAYGNACKKVLLDYIGDEYEVVMVSTNGSVIQFNVVDRINRGHYVELDSIDASNNRDVLNNFASLNGELPDSNIKYTATDINKETIADACHFSSSFIYDYKMTKHVNSLQYVQYTCTFEYGGFLSDATIKGLNDEWGSFYNIVYHNSNYQNGRRYQVSIKFQQAHHCNHVVRLSYGTDLSIKEMQKIIDDVLVGNHRDDFVNNTIVSTNEYQLALSGHLDQCKLSTIAIFSKYFEG